MASEILYDNLSQPVTDESSSLANGEYAGFSFTTGASGGTLADVKAVLVDSMPTDGGDVTVQLYSYGAGVFRNGPDQKLADLGLISDAGLSFSTSPTDIPISTSI